jgi:hypothetical protein
MDHKMQWPTKMHPLTAKQSAALIACVFLSAACANSRNDFIMQDSNAEVASAELQLCGEKRPLEKVGTEFKGHLYVSCEGSGKIIVRLKNNTETSCLIGYVTFGMVDTFEFEIKDGKCE